MDIEPLCPTCSAVSPDGKRHCFFEPNHYGPHSWADDADETDEFDRVSRHPPVSFDWPRVRQWSELREAMPPLLRDALAKAHAAGWEAVVWFRGGPTRAVMGEFMRPRRTRRWMRRRSVAAALRASGAVSTGPRPRDTRVFAESWEWVWRTAAMQLA